MIFYKFVLSTLLIVTVFTKISTTKSIEERKNTTKKALYIKSTKSPKSLVDQLKELTPEDADFVRQLDKQFQTLGENLKIQIVNTNTSSENKNSKRTIDGNLGYGYQTNQPSQSYYFSKPKWQIYPYSQHDIPPNPNYQAQQQYQHQQSYGYQPYRYTMLHQPIQTPHNQYIPQRVHTTVQIQPSKAYEIKETLSGYNTHTEPHQQTSQNEQYGPSPVIVLRIPGPPKYAAHLQALLQQYLEVRAAQYIQLLQDQELRNQQAYHNSRNMNNNDQQYEYVDSRSVENEPQYKSPIVYNNNVDQSHQQASLYYEKPQQSYDDHQDHQHYTSEQQQHQQTYESEEEPNPGYIYVRSEPHETASSSAHLSSKENYPSVDHTQVLFPHSQQSNGYHHQQQQQQQRQNYHPEISHSPLIYQHQQYEYINHQDNHDSDQEFDQTHVSGSNNYVSITQKTPSTATTPPYNYHAHPTTTVATTLQNTKRQASIFSKNSEDQYKKFTMLANRLREKSQVMKKFAKTTEAK